MHDRRYPVFREYQVPVYCYKIQYLLAKYTVEYTVVLPTCTAVLVHVYIVQIEYLRGIHSHIKLEVYIFDILLNRTLNLSVRVSVLIWPVHLRC